jgi:flagellar hook protein FlgE
MNSAVSGLRAHQTMLDVVGNNIANVNTTGFKAGRTAFADILSQTLTAGTSPGGTTGGTNPQQVGLGVRVGAIGTQFTQGGLLTTNKATDLAIQGDGFFLLSDGTVDYYTRAGAFEVDANGYLVDATTGLRVQGIQGDLMIAPGQAIAPQASLRSDFTGNLQTNGAAGSTYTTAITVYDSLGDDHTVSLAFTKSATPNQFDYALSAADASMTIASGATGSILLNDTGTIVSGATGTLTLNYASGATDGQVVTLNFGPTDRSTGVTGYAGESTVALTYQDGYASGALQSFAIGIDGSLTGTFSNGRTDTLGTLLLANFSNPAGLMRVANNLFRDSANSGVPITGTAGTGGRGMIAPGSLEGSNVDLADEFTRLIVAQRGFQANARVITTSDEVMMEAVNLKR